MEKTNSEVVAYLNSLIPGYIDKYFENLNSMVFLTDKVGMLHKVPALTVENVEINILSITEDTQEIKPSPLVETLFTVLPVRPFVRVAIPIETILDAAKENSRFASLLMGTVNSVQKSWEEKFGSYKNNRWGTTFFQYKPLSYKDLDDNVYFDFYGDWASNEVAK
jgi:hypothetical protein